MSWFFFFSTSEVYRSFWFFISCFCCAPRFKAMNPPSSTPPTEFQVAKASESVRSHVKVKTPSSYPRSSTSPQFACFPLLLLRQHGGPEPNDSNNHALRRSSFRDGNCRNTIVVFYSFEFSQLFDDKARWLKANLISALDNSVTFMQSSLSLLTFLVEVVTTSSELFSSPRPSHNIVNYFLFSFVFSIRIL